MMESSDMKNIIVLKNLQSNLIEEAIVVLKNNINVKIPQIDAKEKSKEDKSKNKEYIIKEAEMHIAQYASSLENKISMPKRNKDLEKRYIRLKRITKFLAILAALGMIVNMLKWKEKLLLEKFNKSFFIIHKVRKTRI